ncbi:hypothetical protein NPIL_199571 [Nephila pilipes]|uniref:Uncharacterized protein n=1 Tax=Nephila pilipes TaxID=299642 RepID=A0A8X6Q0E9_NEPPI|nr:hypothetical protein NPIL_199571 [Nephila pilipes]
MSRKQTPSLVPKSMRHLMFQASKVFSHPDIAASIDLIENDSYSQALGKISYLCFVAVCLANKLKRRFIQNLPLVLLQSIGKVALVSILFSITLNTLH